MARSQLTQLIPGAYVDETGALHLDLPELCRSQGYPPTVENQEIVQKAALDLLGDVAEFEVHDDGGDGRWREEFRTGNGPDARGTRTGAV